VHISAIGSEYSFWVGVPSGCPDRKASESGRPVFEGLSRQVLHLVVSPGLESLCNSMKSQDIGVRLAQDLRLGRRRLGVSPEVSGENLPGSTSAGFEF
jgi:hypothetical protein